MPTKYEELCTASKEWTDRIARAQGYLYALQKAFVAYSQIPPDRIEYLKWAGPDQPTKYAGPDEPGRKYSPVAAAQFDDETGQWRLGLILLLSARSQIFFAFRVSERNGKAAVEIREGDAPLLVDVQNPGECVTVFDAILNQIKDALREGKGSIIGFQVGKADEATA
jgi:hypothetical protein